MGSAELHLSADHKLGLKPASRFVPQLDYGLYIQDEDDLKRSNLRKILDGQKTVYDKGMSLFHQILFEGVSSSEGVILLVWFFLSTR